MHIDDPAWRIAAVTGEEPNTIVWQFVRLIEAGYTTDECIVLADRAIEAGHTIAQMVEGILGPDTGPIYAPPETEGESDAP